MPPRTAHPIHAYSHRRPSPPGYRRTPTPDPAPAPAIMSTGESGITSRKKTERRPKMKKRKEARARAAAAAATTTREERSGTTRRVAPGRRTASRWLRAGAAARAPERPTLALNLRAAACCCLAREGKRWLPRESGAPALLRHLAQVGSPTSYTISSARRYARGFRGDSRGILGWARVGSSGVLVVSRWRAERCGGWVGRWARGELGVSGHFEKRFGWHGGIMCGEGKYWLGRACAAIAGFIARRWEGRRMIGAGNGFDGLD